MPIYIAHLRWSSLSTVQHCALQDLARDELASDACWSFRLQVEDSSLRATAVWEGEAGMREFTTGRLAATTTAVRLPEPIVAVFSVPDLLAAGYRPRGSGVPAPRAAGDRVTAAAVG